VIEYAHQRPPPDDLWSLVTPAPGSDVKSESYMPETKRNAKREHRIAMEIVVDAYGPEEQAMGWYYYLDEKLHFPFPATCIAERTISPLRKGEKVEVVGMAPEVECEHEMFVEILWNGRRLGVPLAQLKPAAKVDKDTKEAVADWHYWVDQGYIL
jgi:hypothetical protein